MLLSSLIFAETCKLTSKHLLLAVPIKLGQITRIVIQISAVCLLLPPLCTMLGTIIHGIETKIENYQVLIQLRSLFRPQANQERSTENPRFNDSVCYQRFCCKIEYAVIKKLDMDPSKARITWDCQCKKKYLR